MRLLGDSEVANDPANNGAIVRRRAFLMPKLSEVVNDSVNDGAIVRRRAFLMLELSEVANDPAPILAHDRSSLDPFLLTLVLNSALATSC